MNKKVTMEQEKEISRLYKLDKRNSLSVLAKQFGYSMHTISNVLERNNVPKRSPSEANTGVARSNGIEMGRRLYRKRGRELFGKCCSCGKASNLHIHHVNGEHYDNVDSNLIRLCSQCHQAVHHYLVIDKDFLLSLSFKGLGMKKIAEEMGVSVDKVKNELARIGLCNYKRAPKVPITPMIEFLAKKLERGEYLYD